MNKTAYRFSRSQDMEFTKVLKQRVNQYFKDNDISKTANPNMVIKTVFMICLYFVPFILMLTQVVTSTWGMLGMWTIMAFGMAGIGLSIMHDANHASYSNNKKVNDILSYLINFVGGNAENWRIQHNVLHHTYTNIEGADEDMNSLPILRFSPHKQKRKIHRFQFIYAWFFYGLLTLSWATIKEFLQIKRFHQQGLTKKGKSLNRYFIELFLWKLFYFAYLIALPILILPVNPWFIVLGFVVMHFISGVTLSAIFQAAHIMPDCDYALPDDQNQMKNNWTVHQLLNTCNFGNRNKILTWYVGGLNHQIEHHLFPNICHIHYDKLSKIVKETAEEFKIPYYSYKTFIGALVGHGKMLWSLGR